MSKAVNAVIVGLTVFILLTGSIWYVTVARGPNKVSAVEVEQGWESVNETTSVLWGQVTFRNPYDFRIDITSFTYEFWVNEERWARENSTDVVRIEPRGEAILPARIEMNTTRMDEWFLDHIAKGERTTVWFTGNSTFRVGGGEIAVPFEERRTWETGLRRNIEDIRNCPQPEPLPCIADASVKWVLEDDKSLLQLVFTIRNNNLDEMTISNRSAVVALGGLPIAKTNATDKVLIARESGRFFEFSLPIQTSKVLDWWVHHVQACEKTDATLDLVFDYEVKATPLPPQPTLPTGTSAPPPTTTTTAPPPPPTTTTTAPPPTTTTTAPPPPPPPEPVANLTANAATGYAPLDVTFTIQDDSGETQQNLGWTLNFGDEQTTSGTGAAASVDHQYTAPGTYQAVLTFTSDAGQSTDSVTITVEAPPVTTSAEPTPTTTTTSQDPTPTTTANQESPTTATTSDAGSGALASSPSSSQSFTEGMRKTFEYPWRAAAVQLGILDDFMPAAEARPTTNGVERIAWDLELGEFRTGFACDLES